MNDHTTARRGWDDEPKFRPRKPETPPWSTLDEGASSPRVTPLATDDRCSPRVRVASVGLSPRRPTFGRVTHLPRTPGPQLGSIPNPTPHREAASPPNPFAVPWDRDASPSCTRSNATWLVGHDTIRTAAGRRRCKSGRSPRIVLTAEKFRFRTHGDARPRVNKSSAPSSVRSMGDPVSVPRLDNE